jgi:hypothetical protein
VVLAARPDAGAVFKQWTGACVGQGAICSLTLKDNASANAVFGLASQTTTSTTTRTQATTTTTTSTTTTTATPTTTTTARTGHHGLDAQLIGVKPAKSQLGIRVENVEIRGGETVNAALLLSRNGRSLAHTSVADIRAGDRVLTLPIPGKVAKGRAILTITLADSAGNHHTWTQTINIPR